MTNKSTKPVAEADFSKIWFAWREAGSPHESANFSNAETAKALALWLDEQLDEDLQALEVDRGYKYPVEIQVYTTELGLLGSAKVPDPKIAVNFKRTELSVFEPGGMIMPEILRISSHCDEKLLSEGILLIDKIKKLILRKYGLD